MPFAFREGRPTVWFRPAVERSNCFCPYCGRTFLDDGHVIASNCEHLVGRKFVPHGYLGLRGAWNFIFRACVECNTRKSNLERHVSSVSLWSSPARTEAAVNADAQRKASHDVHPATRRLVRDSSTSLVIRSGLGSFPGVQVAVTLNGPPQLDAVSAKDLATMQVQALFSLITSKNPMVLETSRWLRQDAIWVGRAHLHTDWGNQWLKGVARRTAGWPTPLLVSTAGGCFKAVLRKDPSREEWFWAVEWNRSLRIVGGIGREQPSVFEGLREPDRIASGDSSMRFWQEIRLDPADDEMFR